MPMLSWVLLMTRIALILRYFRRLLIYPSALERPYSFVAGLHKSTSSLRMLNVHSRGQNRHYQSRRLLFRLFPALPREPRLDRAVHQEKLPLRLRQQQVPQLHLQARWHQVRTEHFKHLQPELHRRLLHVQTPVPRRRRSRQRRHDSVRHLRRLVPHATLRSANPWELLRGNDLRGLREATRVYPSLRRTLR